MVFSSIPFVFFFLPLCLIFYYGTSFLPCPGRRLDVQTPSERGKFPVQEQAARGRSRRSPAYGRSCFHGEGAIALKNAILLVFSLVFYAWGEPVYILLMLFDEPLWKHEGTSPVFSVLFGADQSFRAGIF